MVIGMYIGFVSNLSAKQFICPVCNYFVSVHICGGSGTCLVYINNKVLIQIPFNYFFCCPDYGIPGFLCYMAKLHISFSCCKFDHPHSLDKFARKSCTAYREIVYGPCSLCPVVCFFGNFHLSHRIGFYPVSRSCFSHLKCLLKLNMKMLLCHSI